MGEIDWPQFRLRDVTTTITKGTTPTTVGATFASTGIRFVKVEAITEDGRIDSSRLSFIDEDGDAILARSRLAEGDILFTIAGTIGRSSLVTSDLLPANTNQAVAIVRPDRTYVEPGFVYYVLRDRSRIGRAMTRVVQSVQANLSLSELAAVELGIPPIKEQRAVSCVLAALDDKIELNRRMAATLEEMARALFKSWFVDFDPVRAKAKGRDTGLPSEIADLFPDRLVDSALGEIPEGWAWTSLDRVANFLNGLALQKYPVTDDDRTLPVIKIAQLRAGATLNADRCSSDIPTAYVVEDGDVLFSWSGSLECAFWAGGRGALNQHLFKVTANDAPAWLGYLGVQHHLPGFRETAAGKATTMGHIQRHHLTDARLPVPPADAIAALGGVLEPMLDRSWKLRVEIRQLTGLRDALLPKLVSGQIRISDPQDFLARMEAVG